MLSRMPEPTIAKPRRPAIQPKPPVQLELLVEAVVVKPPLPAATGRIVAQPAPAPDDDEDYTGSVCLLHKLTQIFPFYEEVLIDAKDLQLVAEHQWIIVRIGRPKYLRIVRGRNIYLSRFIMNEPDGLVVDHINRHPLDNRRANLRAVSVAQNNLNRAKGSFGKSVYKGVSYTANTKKWRAQARGREGRVFLGEFRNEIDAARAYNAHAKKHYGQIAYLNPV